MALGNLRLAIDNPTTALKTINFSGTTPVICQISRLEANDENSQFFFANSKLSLFIFLRSKNIVSLRMHKICCSTVNQILRLIFHLTTTIKFCAKFHDIIFLGTKFRITNLEIVFRKCKLFKKSIVFCLITYA